MLGSGTMESKQDTNTWLLSLRNPCASCYKRIYRLKPREQGSVRHFSIMGQCVGQLSNNGTMCFSFYRPNHLSYNIPPCAHIVLA